MVQRTLRVGVISLSLFFFDPVVLKEIFFYFVMDAMFKTRSIFIKSNKRTQFFDIIALKFYISAIIKAQRF